MALRKRTRSGRATKPRGAILPDGTAPQFTAKDVHEAFMRYDRTPFIELLVRLWKDFPDEATLMAFAKKKPDAYINSLISMARIAGYTDKQEVTHNMNLNINQLSDSQLEDRARALMRELGFAGGEAPMLELEVQPTGEAEGHDSKHPGPAGTRSGE